MLTLKEFSERSQAENFGVSPAIVGLLTQPNPMLDGYVAPRLTLRERLRVVWEDRVHAAWRVLMGKAYAEDYY